MDVCLISSDAIRKTHTHLVTQKGKVNSMEIKG